MSRHLIIRCDAPGCAEYTETRALDTEPTSIDVPGGWLTLRQSGHADKHYCSLDCLHRLSVSVALDGLVIGPPAEVLAAIPVANPAPVVRETFPSGIKAAARKVKAS